MNSRMTQGKSLHSSGSQFSASTIEGGVHHPASVSLSLCSVGLGSEGRDARCPSALEGWGEL